MKFGEVQTELLTLKRGVVWQRVGSNFINFTQISSRTRFFTWIMGMNATILHGQKPVWVQVAVRPLGKCCNLQMKFCEWIFSTRTSRCMVGIWIRLKFAWIDTEWSGIPSTWNSFHQHGIPHEISESNKLKFRCTPENKECCECKPFPDAHLDEIRVQKASEWSCKGQISTQRTQEGDEEP